MQAKRIANLIELFGVNTFSSPDEHNTWGSWPANYSPESVIKALKYIVGDSGFALRLREYHYAGRADMQAEWLPQIVAAFPGTRVALCPGANASVDDVPTMLALAADPRNGVAWIEGLNEPNTNFGSGEVPYAMTQAIQDACWQGRRSVDVGIMGPSIVAGTPHPEGWIQGYCETPENLAALNAAMHEGQGHYYPPGSPDVPNTGYSVNEYIGGLWTAYAQKTIHLTEFHPTLYNSEGNKPDEAGWSGQRDAYYALTTLLRCAQNGTQGVWWYALFDYGTTYRCGLFPQYGDTDPRPTANALRALCAICADRGDRHGFETGELAMEISGLPETVTYEVYQASDGRFLVPIWHSAPELDRQPVVRVHVTFGETVGEVTLYDPLHGVTPIWRQTEADEVHIDLPPGVRVLEISP